MPFIAGLISIFIIAIAVIIGWRILNGDARLLRDVEVQHTVLTPNADGDNDVTRISYEISRNATVSIYFENEEGERFYFRENKRRGSGEYEVLFSGVVQGFLLEDEEIDGDILNRLLKDGDYRWVIEAEDEQGVIEQSNGSLQIVDADPILPEVRNFTIHPISKLFTPNRDGIDDRVKPQFFLPKDVEELRVFLEMPDGTEFPITELERDVPATEEGMHIFDWDGGVDDGATPPPDGTYPLVVMSRDAEGQRIRLEDELTIQFGGVPRADIFSPPTGETLSFDATAVLLCDTLEFTLTVRNYGTTPVRTSGPAPGTIYDSTWNYNTVGWPTESGVFRVGIGFENELSPYPYRWAVGAESDLQKIGDSYYLMPGERAVVTGGIRVIDEFGVRNPQPMWAGLIHEDVEISQFNRNVDPHAILIDIPDESNIETCEARNIPSRAEE
ncbi:MAG: hypothetical protein AAF490_21125 [Chloroflexota bacterium]